MQKYYIPHKIKIGDITHLADNDSIFAIKNKISEEDMIVVQSPNGIFDAIVTYIEKNSVEVEILKKISDVSLKNSITILQSVSNSSKFGLFLEKITEIGVDSVIPITSELCLIDKNKFEKDRGLYNKIILDAKEQSRNPNPPTLEEVIDIKDLKDVIEKDVIKLCLVTENVNSKLLSDVHIPKENEVILAFGPESGWSFKDITYFKKLGFTFVNLKGNILRTETTPIVVTSIIKFIQQKI